MGTLFPFLLMALNISKSIAQKPANFSTAALVKLKTKEDSIQYALGIYVGQWFMRTGFVTLNPNLFMTGVGDVMQSKPLLIKDSSATALLNKYQQEAQKDVSKKLEDQLFASLKNKPNVGRLPSGVQYSIVKAGTGVRPAEKDSVVFNFKGALPNGTVFEDTFAKKLGIATTPGSVMPGLNEALQLMPQGSIWEIYIPSNMAYGEKGNNNIIPPNSALVVLLELVLVKRNG